MRPAVMTSTWGHFSAARPARAICSSWLDCTPETPIAPTHSPSWITGTAPWLSEPGGKIGEGGALLDAVLPELGRLLGERGGFCLFRRHGRRDRRRAVHALEAERHARIVDDRDRDLPAVLFGLGEAGRQHLPGVGRCETGFCAHGRFSAGRR